MKRFGGFAFLGCLVLATPTNGAPPFKMPPDDMGGATPLNVREWFKADDYPDKAVMWHQQGYVTVSFTVSTEGRVANCQLARSSGYPVLDEVPCKLLTKRARFTPAKDSNGAPVATQASTSFAFWTVP